MYHSEVHNIENVPHSHEGILLMTEVLIRGSIFSTKRRKLGPFVDFKYASTK